LPLGRCGRPTLGCSPVRRRGAIAILALVPVLGALPGCGGSSSKDTSSTGGTTAKSPALKPPGSKGAVAPKAVSKPPPGDAGFMALELQRATYQSLLGGVARGRAGSAAVKAYAQRIARERAGIAADTTTLARKLKVKLPRVRFSAADSNAVRSLVPLSRTAFEKAYLNLELRSIPADISRAQTEARSGANAKVRALAAKHLAKYRSELAAARGVNP
jgi:predicted outer membrane protein